MCLWLCLFLCSLTHHRYKWKIEKLIIIMSAYKRNLILKWLRWQPLWIIERCKRKTFYFINWGHIVCAHIPFGKHITRIHRFNEMKACAECHFISICCINIQHRQLPLAPYFHSIEYVNIHLTMKNEWNILISLFIL